MGIKIFAGGFYAQCKCIDWSINKKRQHNDVFSSTESSARNFPKIYDWFFDRYHRQNNFITKSKCTLTAQNDVTRLMLFVFWRQCGRVVVLSFISILHRFLLPSYLNSAFTITSYYNQNQSRIITVKIEAFHFLCRLLKYTKQSCIFSSFFSIKL